jgi:hypothetical protein
MTSYVTVTNADRAIDPDRYVPEGAVKDGGQDAPLWVECCGGYYSPPRCYGHGLSWDFHWDREHGDWLCPACWAGFEADAEDAYWCARYA